MDWVRLVNPRVNCVGQGVWNKGFVEPERRLHDHELVIFERGSCELTLGGRKFEMRPNHWVVIGPDVPHRSQALCSGVVRRWVHFDWLDGLGHERAPVCVYAPQLPEARLVRRAPDFIPSGLLRGVLSGRGADIVHALFDALELRAQHSDPCERLTGKAVFLELLLRLLAAERPDAAASPASPAPLVFKVKGLLDQMPGPAHSVRELIASLGQSYEHLCRSFRREYKLTPVNYLNRLRVETAKELLESSSLNVDQIAERCGFAGATYFCRVFKRQCKLTPLEYRRKLR